MIVTCMSFFLSSTVAPLACVQPPPPPPIVATVRTPERSYGPVATPVGEPWRSLAVCESGMDGEPRWDYNGSSGFDGGLQFHPRTWTAFGGGEFAPYAYGATKREQVEVAGRVLAEQGWGAWPTCSEKLGLR